VDRSDVLARWQHPAGPPVFLISTKAGGLGLDLTEADHVFHLDPWWNPAAEDQATDRAHRIGQTRPVMVYKLVAADTVEEKILELQDRKRRLFAATVDTDRLEVDALRREDLEAVFGDAGAMSEDDEDDDEFELDAAFHYEPVDEPPSARKLAEFVPLSRSGVEPPASVAADGPPHPDERVGAVIELFPKR
jgi:Helicase conserved C-terminal domain